MGGIRIGWGNGVMVEHVSTWIVVRVRGRAPSGVGDVLFAPVFVGAGFVVCETFGFGVG